MKFIDFMAKKSGIYKISCPECGESYIGQTKRRFIDRLKEHDHECRKLTGAQLLHTSIFCHYGQST